jgi:2,5-diketo-D-gluconate reductase A
MTGGATLSLGTGTEMPRLGLGTWQLSGPGATEAIRYAIALGYRLLDAAFDYGSEEHIAAALGAPGVDRDELFLIDKVEEHEDARAATERRCRSLGVERLDLCLIHRPPPSGAGEQLWEGLIAAREHGRAREIGVSNYSIDQLERLIAATGVIPVVNQIEWTPFGHSGDVLEHARARGIVVQAYSPLTRGERLDDGTIGGIAASHDKSAAQVILRWNLQTGTAPVPKAAAHRHLEENIEVFDFELDREQMRRLDALNSHYSSLGGLPYV